MKFHELGVDIIQLHLLPLLSHSDILYLASTNATMFNIMAALRFQSTTVSNENGFILDHLKPSTISMIKRITLNGTEDEHNRVFACGYFTGVISATVSTTITRAQQPAFSRFLKQLSMLTEEEDGHNDADLSSLSGMTSGALSHLRTIRLEAALPVQLGQLLGVAKTLTSFHFLPFIGRMTTDYEHYADNLKHALLVFSDKKLTPQLRLVQAVPGEATTPAQQQIRNALLKSIWTAAASHGGWRLLGRKTSAKPVVVSPAAWEVWWANFASDFSINIDEFELFTQWCDERKRYPRLDEYISGNIEIKINTDIPNKGIFRDTSVFGVSIKPDSNTNVCALLQVLSKDTRTVTISLDSLWGTVPVHQLGSEPFEEVQSLRITGPSSQFLHSRLQYCDNISNALLNTLAVSQWHSLRSLSLPVVAFQKEPLPKTRNTAACGIHIKKYKLDWLANCSALEAIELTDWNACFLCKVKRESTLQGGLRHLPLGVKIIQISGYFRCPTNARGFWRKAMKDEILNVLGNNRTGLALNLRSLRVGEI